MNKVLIIDDEKDFRNLLGRILEREGFEVLKSASAKEGEQAYIQNDVQVVIMDVRLPDSNGIQLMQDFKEIKAEPEFICLTAFGKIPDGVNAMKLGAFDYLEKGDDNKRIIPLVSKAAEKSVLKYKLSDLHSRVHDKFGFDNIIGEDETLLECIAMAKKVAPLDTTVLLTGATGTGKEVFAKAIHSASPRRAESFIPINCSTLGPELLQSELFGYKAGAFTGAVREKRGLFQEAHHGTLFLDEIGELGKELQAKILRVLEQGTFIKLGDIRETRVDVRIIAATNRDLRLNVANDTFREDLYYRLSAFTIALPSLNGRKSDIAQYARHFVVHFATRFNKRVPYLSDEFLMTLKRHNWKGNIRELKNVIERAVILCESDILEPDLLPLDFTLLSTATGGRGNLSLENIEKLHIKNVLEHTGNDKRRSANILGIGLTTLYNKIKKYGL